MGLSGPAGFFRNRKAVVRAGLGTLLAMNLIAAFFAFRTPGGSLTQLESELTNARQQLMMRQKTAQRLKSNLEQVKRGRQSGDAFMKTAFLDRRAAYSTLEVELADAAKSAGIKAKERTYGYEPIEGSESLGIVTINANYEGTYADLIEFVNAVDRSTRLLILDSLQAQPIQGAGTLAINLKLYAFFSEEGKN
jgi:Tfp pilus assembly protein PilO